MEGTPPTALSRTVASAIFLQRCLMEYPNVHISELFIEFLWVDVVYDVRTVWSVVEWSDWEAGPGKQSHKDLLVIWRCWCIFRRKFYFMTMIPENIIKI